MPRRKDTLICKSCKQTLPREAFDLCHMRSGRVRPYERCRECRERVGWLGYGRPALESPNPSGLCMCGCGQVTPIARYNSSPINYVKGEHTKYVEGHGPHVTSGEKWRIDPETGCWVWLRAKSNNGTRGLVGAWVGGKRSTLRAHRWVYEQHKGPIPEGMELDHLCRNPICVNPDHLEPVTHAENMRRMWEDRKG